MEHVHHKASGATFFRYRNAADEDANAVGGGGESLQHRLFKEALSRAEFIELRLGTAGSHNVRINHGETEKKIYVPESKSNLYCDVFIGFKCDTDLGLKWQNKVCVEVLHSHAVEPGKIDALRALHVPTIEVELPPALAYDWNEDDTTDEREQRYLENMSKQLKFLAATVVSDPSSLEFVEKQLKQAQQSLALQTREVEKLRRETKELVESATTSREESAKQWTAKLRELELEVRAAARARNFLFAIGALLGFGAGLTARLWSGWPW